MAYTYDIYVDGGCRGNGQPGCIGAAAAYLIRPSGETRVRKHDLPERDRNGNEPTNQRAELIAINLALGLLAEELRDFDEIPRFQVRIFSDSKYAIGCMTGWASTWASNGWRNTNGAPVANQDLIKRNLDWDEDFSRYVDITYTWIRRSWNEAADRLCNEALDEQEEQQRRAGQRTADRARRQALRLAREEASRRYFGHTYNI